MGGKVCLYEPILFKRMLKVKFLGAKGFNTEIASQEFQRAMDSWTGKSGGAKVLRTARTLGNRLLNIYRNVPDTGYGL